MPAPQEATIDELMIRNIWEPRSAMEEITRRTMLRAGAAGILMSAWPARGDPSSPQDVPMVLVPEGPFLMGTSEEEAAKLAQTYGYHVSWLEGETPQRKKQVKAFLIDVYPVTNEQYARFCRATGHEPPPWPGGAPPADRLDHPVVNVNRPDARAYAAWAGKRLPAEAEWEKAARGTEGRMFPWGDAFDPDACCCGRSIAEGTAPVTAHPKGVSPYGVMDMIGNAAEWCEDSPGPGSAFIKGGCFLSREIINLRPAARNMSGFDVNRSPFYGFRCVREAN